ncbi:hypothetical protein L6R52_38760, partial [Myxococcota bacterium]|nr:hypothetical protein [Myxococcota bacterium]
AASGAPFGLNLSTAAAAHAGLVARASAQCPSVARVAPSDPSQSYLIWKLQGAGPCYSGARMPIGAAPLGAADLATIEGWIARGAPND